MIRILSVLLLGISALANATDKYPKNPDVDVQHYRFEIDLSDDSDEIKCIATIRVNLKKTDITSIRFDLTGVTAGKGMMVENVLQLLPSGETVRPYKHSASDLVIDLDHPSGAQETVTVKIIYKGVPA